MMTKAYKLPNGKKAVFEYDVCGIGKITLECMDELMAMITDRPQGEQMMTKEIHDINTRALDFVAELIDYIAEYPDDDYMTMECLCRKLVKHGLINKVDGYYMLAEQTERGESTDCAWK